MEKIRATFERCFNFRDLGGVPGKNGLTVRGGRLFRSDSMCWLSERDGALMTSMGIETVIDLRSAEEFAREPTSPHLSVAEIRNVPLFDRSTAFASLEALTEDPLPGQFYVEIVEQCQSSIAAAFTAVATANFPLVFHCAAGKDRTGVLAALLLGSLGVSDADIVRDYALSDDSIPPLLAWSSQYRPAIADELHSLPEWLVYAKPHHMEALVTHLTSSYGGVAGYLEAIGVARDKRERLATELLT